MKKTYIKLKINPTENLLGQGNELQSKRYVPRFNYQLSYLVKFIKHKKHNNGEEIVFHKWIKSDFIYNH